MKNEKEKIKQKKEIKDQSSILITCITCILLLMMLCFIGISSSKGTYSLSVSDCTWGNAWASGINIYVSVTAPDGSTYGDCCEAAGYKTSTTNTCLQYADELSNHNGYYYHNKYSSIYNCVSGYQDAGTSGSYCYKCNSGTSWNGSTCASDSSGGSSSDDTTDDTTDDSTSSSCNFGNSYISGNTVKIYVKATGTYSNSGCCSYYGFNNDGYYCTQEIKKATTSDGYYNYFYSTSNNYCIDDYSTFSTASSIGVSSSSAGLSNVCRTNLIKDSENSENLIYLKFMTMDVNGTYYEYTSMSKEKNTYGWAKFDMPVATSLGNPTLSGYTFNGWTKIQGACSSPISPSDTYFKTASSYTLYACFTKNGTTTSTSSSIYDNYTRTLNFYTMNKDGLYYVQATANCTLDINKITLLTGGKGYCLIQMPVVYSNNPTLSGYTFTGWSKILGVCYDPISPSEKYYLTNSSHSLYACFTKNDTTTSSSCNFDTTASIKDGIVYMKLSPTGYSVNSCCLAYDFSNTKIDGINYCTQKIESDDTNKYYYYKSYNPKYCVDDYTYDSSNSICYKCYDNYGLNSGGSCVTSSESTGIYIEPNSNITYEEPTYSDDTGGGSYTPTPDGDDDTGGESYTPTPDGDDEVIENPQTGSLAIFISWIVALATICYAIWYFKSLKKAK